MAKKTQRAKVAPTAVAAETPKLLTVARGSTTFDKTAAAAYGAHVKALDTGDKNGNAQVIGVAVGATFSEAGARAEIKRFRNLAGAISSSKGNGYVAGAFKLDDKGNPTCGHAWNGYIEPNHHGHAITASKCKSAKAEKGVVKALAKLRNAEYSALLVQAVNERCEQLQLSERLTVAALKAHADKWEKANS